MSFPSGDLYQLAKIRYDDRQREIARRNEADDHRRAAQTDDRGKVQELMVAVGMALLPLGKSLRTPITEQRSLDVSS